MAITFKQTTVDAACSYLMTGGPNGGELTNDQYLSMVYLARIPNLPGSIISDFGWQLQLAIKQKHSGIANSKNLCRDSQGAFADAYQSNPTVPGIGGIANNELARFSVSISG